MPQIEIYNKIDLLDGESARVERNEDGTVKRIWLSAAAGDGESMLVDALAEFFRQEHVRRVLRLAATDGRLRARFFELGTVYSDKLTDDGGWEMDVELPKRHFDRLVGQDEALARRLLV